MRPSPPPTAKPLVLYLFCEGKTEYRYLEDLVVRLRLSQSIRVLHPIVQSDPERLLEGALAWIGKNRRQILPSTRVETRFWLICDDDGRSEAIARFQGAVRRHATEIDAYGLEFAWMAPCFEVWPLLHLMAPSNIPAKTEAAQRALAELMPKYKHDRNASVDCAGQIVDPATMRGAIKAAENWERTFGAFPECVGRAPRYAGIHRLIGDILSRLPT